ncbi:MAG TPA: hypothetical protein VKN63_04155 [Afifellaceae bacterium]|nr:hypothetical protein [Afifellaceae bacterium]
MATLTTETVVAPVAASTDHRYVDWPAIIAGAFLATALSLVLITFGSAIGLSMSSPLEGEGASRRWVTIAAGIWILWTAVSSFAAGGYLSGRMRRRADDASEDEVEARDGAHGVVMWAVGAVLGSLLAVSGISGLAGSAASGAAAALEAADVQVTTDVDYVGSTLLRSENAIAGADARTEVSTVLGRGILDGEFSEGERTYLAGLVASETGLSADAARNRVDTTIDESLTARQAALEAADQLRIAGLIGAFVLAASLMVSAAAAYFAATIGGNHRDRNLGFRLYGT